MLQTCCSAWLSCRYERPISSALHNRTQEWLHEVERRLQELHCFSAIRFCSWCSNYVLVLCLNVCSSRAQLFDLVFTV